jgi:hypothetical protein
MFMIAAPFLVLGSELHYWRSRSVTGEDKVASLNGLAAGETKFCAPPSAGEIL